MLKRSLKLKVWLMLFGSLIVLLLAGLLFNNFFSKPYYSNTRINNLSDTYQKLNKIVGNNTLEYGTDIYDQVENLEGSSNTSIYVISTVEIVPGLKGMKYMFPININMSESVANKIHGDRYEKIARALRTYMYGAVDENSAPVLLDAVNDKYEIYRYNDDRVGSEYIDLIGYIDNEDLVLIRMNYADISEGAKISNQLFLMSGIIVAVLGTIFTYLFSRSIERPIKDLSKITNEMAKLNFSSKYVEKRSDEIGVLGQNVNLMSNKLEQTITELKNANIELEKDIENKNKIDEMRREFISNVSHELKTPLALIQGYAEGLADNVNDDPESREFYCEVIMDESMKINKMVNKLLNLCELEFGNSKVQTERFDIIELAREVSVSFDIVSKQKNVSLVFNSDDKPVYVWADRYMIEEVLTNYISNAFNHVSGNNVIDISFAEDKDKIKVSVFNTGENIPEEFIDHIWEKFFKVDKARTREYGGSGIGLSIVKAIMDTHHSRYGVVNHEAGVEFWFELPTKAEI